jgi:hypothetical protein
MRRRGYGRWKRQLSQVRSERPLAGHQNAVAETPQDPGLKVNHHGVVLSGCDPDARQWPQWIVRDGTTLLG